MVDNEKLYTQADMDQIQAGILAAKEKNVALKQWAECLEFRCMQYTHGALCDQCDHKSTCQAQ